MPFTHVTSSYKRSILTEAFEEYCRENDIVPTSREYDDTRELMLILFQDGHRTVPHLKKAAVEAMRRAR